MTDINAKGLSRRAFFGLGATAAAGAAMAGLAGCAPASESDTPAPAAAGDTAMAATGTATYEWEIAPEPITDIASTVDTDILVIGAGLAGCACGRCAGEGRQGDRRREDGQLQRARRRLRRHQLALHGGAGRQGGQGERYSTGSPSAPAAPTRTSS